MAFKVYKLRIILLLTLLGAFLHFYNLNWGAPFYFHPDERNIASSVSQLTFPQQMNPHFFAYGSLPIYSIYFTGILINFLHQILTPNYYTLNPSFEQAILISRFYSAFFATFLIPLLFLIGKKIKNETVGFLAAMFATTSVGFLQFAHFGTFEMWLTFFTVLLFWLCLYTITTKRIILMGIVLGILLATKVSSLILFPLPLLAFLLYDTNKTKQLRLFKHLTFQIFRGRSIFHFFKNSLLLIWVSAILYCCTNPFVFLDYHAFKGSMTYESSLVIGTLPVFYTGEFYNTTPILFQFFKSFPFLLNPFITILFILSFCYLLFVIKQKNHYFFLLALYFLVLFLSQAFFFAKWTRYLIPTLPFIYLIISLALVDVIARKNDEAILFKRLPRSLWSLAMTIIILVCSIFSCSYFITAFVRDDTRIAAVQFAQKFIPSNVSIMSEVYDLGITPFNDHFSHITLFNVYELDNNSLIYNEQALKKELAKSSYIILPSQRIIKTRLMHKEQFPKGNIFYSQLINGELGFQKIYETPCDFWCNVAYLGSPTYRFEQTVNVFDRPTVLIFKKTYEK